MEDKDDKDDIHNEMTRFTKKIIDSISNLQWQIRKQRDLIEQRQGSRYLKQNYVNYGPEDHEDL